MSHLLYAVEAQHVRGHSPRNGQLCPDFFLARDALRESFRNA